MSVTSGTKLAKGVVHNIHVQRLGRIIPIVQVGNPSNELRALGARHAEAVCDICVFKYGDRNCETMNCEGTIWVTEDQFLATKIIGVTALQPKDET